MLSDCEVADLLQAQYDGRQEVFDYSNTLGVVSYSIKHYPDFELLLFEGSHNVPDWFSNFQASLIRVNGFGGVEQGFYEDIPAATADIQAHLVRSKPVRIGGHSRGAAHGHIAARQLILNGYSPALITRTLFGSPRPGDLDFAVGLAGSPCHSYRNYRSFDAQDIVCDVPLHFFLERYVHPEPQIKIDVAPMADDPWLILDRHHLFLYEKGKLCDTY